MLADDTSLAPAFEEYLICKVYLDLLEEERKPEGSTTRSFVRTRLRAIGRRIATKVGEAYPGVTEDIVGLAANLILGRQPVGRAHYISMLPTP